MDKDNLIGLSTKLLHARNQGRIDGSESRPLSTPIYRTSAYYFEDLESARKVFNNEEPGHVYSRGSNPTIEDLQAKLALLENGEACIVTSSGMGAIGTIFLGLLKKGDHLILDSQLYSATDTLCRSIIQKFGIETSFIDLSDISNLEKGIQANTKMIFFETPTNPAMKIIDIQEISDIAKEKNIKVVVDNTFAPPPVQYPLDLGADLVMHSLTKYINGHGDVIAGAVIGNREDILKMKRQALGKLTGSIMSPSDAYLIIRGLKTLELRMERHSSNALALAEFLSQQELVSNVFYPGLATNPSYDIAKKQMRGMYSGIIAFEMIDEFNGLSSFELGRLLVDSLKYVRIAVSLGDPETLIQHPYSMTHYGMNPEDLRLSGVSQGLIRLSVGLENQEDIISDFKQALEKIANR